MMQDVDNAIARAALAGQLADAFLAAPWTAGAIAESAAGRIGGWPHWLEALTLSVVAVFRTAPMGDRDALATAIESFLKERGAGWEPAPAVPVSRWPVARLS